MSALNGVANGYTDSQDMNGYVARVQIIAKAKQLVQALASPDMTPNYHGLNVGVPTSDDTTDSKGK